MAIRVEEKNESPTRVKWGGTGDPIEQDMEFHVLVDDDTDDADDVKSAILASANVPSSIGDMARETIEVERVDYKVWSATVRYEVPGIILGGGTLPPVGSVKISGDTTGGNQHITVSKATVSYARSGETVPDFKKAIGVSRDAVEGVDIVVPTFKWTEQHVKANSSITAGYVGDIQALTGRTNNATFRGYAIGEVLFLGVTFDGPNEEDKWLFTFHFAAEKNKTGLTVGAITGVAKKGWEYLWVSFVDEDGGTPIRPIKVPASAHVEQVYDDGNFSGLDIGTGTLL